MPIKSNPIMLHISRRDAVVRVLMPEGYKLGEVKSLERFLDWINQEKKSRENKELTPLITMVDQIINAGLNYTKVDITDNLITFYVYFEDYTDFDVIYSKMRHNEELKNSCSVDYYLTQKIWFPYSIDIKEDDNFISILGKILNLNFGPKTRKFYEAIIPHSVPKVELARASIKDNYLTLIIHSKDSVLLEDYEKELFNRHDKIKEGYLID